MGPKVELCQQRQNGRIHDIQEERRILRIQYWQYQTRVEARDIHVQAIKNRFVSCETSKVCLCWRCNMSWQPLQRNSPGGSWEWTKMGKAEQNLGMITLQSSISTLVLLKTRQWWRALIAYVSIVTPQRRGHGMSDFIYQNISIVPLSVCVTHPGKRTYPHPAHTPFVASYPVCRTTLR